MTFFRSTLACFALIACAGAAAAGGHGGNPAVTARKAHMQLYNHNLAILGAMAKGEAEYSAEAATAAANNLVAVASIDETSYWVPGSSNADLGGETRALPAIVEPGSERDAFIGDLRLAVAALADVAGSGQDAIGPALGPVGAACGACHRAYRAPSN